MLTIINIIQRFFREVDKTVLLLVTVLTAIVIFLNYYFGVDQWISSHNSFFARLFLRSVLFLSAFALPYLFYSWITGSKYFGKRRFLFLLLLAPMIFALKASVEIPFTFSDNYFWDNYWNYIIYWPLLVIITGFILFIIWKLLDSDQPFYGLKTKGMSWKPYLIMLLIMVPLIAAASTQPDFQATYPKLKVIGGNYPGEDLSWWHKLLFELSYGSDFITIELFFRGFLILAFIKWAGKDAILPMACFYCTIHFGKPLGECISSYFGGMLLGVVVYHTRSILGGLMVHLGIAWLMELGGYLAVTR
jgi:hypothetical protein